MNINGYNPYKKGFDMLVADIQRAEALDELAKPCWSFDHMSFNHVSFARSVLHAQDEELERLRKIEAAAVACSEHPVWNDDQFYGLMTELQRALRGEVGAGETVKPVAWVRFCSDGCYEGPIMDEQIEDVRKNSGAWTPLYARHNVLADRPAAPIAAGPATEGSEVERRVGGAVPPAPTFAEEK